MNCDIRKLLESKFYTIRNDRIMIIGRDISTPTCSKYTFHASKCFSFLFDFMLIRDLK